MGGPTMLEHVVDVPRRENVAVGTVPGLADDVEDRRALVVDRPPDAPGCAGVGW
jgi:hypothetical protein